MAEVLAVEVAEVKNFVESTNDELSASAGQMVISGAPMVISSEFEVSSGTENLSTEPN